MSSQQDSSDRSGTFENDGLAIAANSSVTFHMGSGTDDSTNRYLGLPGGVSYGIDFVTTVACSISEINGRTLKVAKSIGTGGWVEPHTKITRFTVNSGTATYVEVGAKQ